MKRVSLIAVGAAVLVSGCMEKGDRGSGDAPLVRVEWAGAARVREGTNGTKLQEILALPTTAEFRNEAFAKLARAPRELWKASLAQGSADQATLFRPLLEDLWTNECVVELRGPANRPGLFIDARLDERRAQLWSTNLWQVAAAWRLANITTTGGQGSNGWTARGKDLNIFYLRSGTRVLAGISSHGRAGAVRQIAAAGGTNPTILAAHVNCPALSRAFPVFAKYRLPPVDFSVTARGETLRTEGKLVYSERLPIKLEPWKIPTNIVSDPLISFTCGQGIAPFVNQSRILATLRMKNPPNQFYLWGLGSLHAQTFLAAPVANATNLAREMAPRLPDVAMACFTNTPGKFFWISNRSEWVWTGLPMIIPHVRPARAAGGEYIFAGLFPVPPTTNPAPAELFAQVLTRTNLVYYDWELSQERLPHARQIFQLIDIINRRRMASTNVTSQRWIRDVAPLLDNTITEVTLASPRELSFVRKSAVGFTGMEMVLLTRWIDSPGFPFRYEPPPLLSTRTNRPPAVKKKEP